MSERSFLCFAKKVEKRTKEFFRSFIIFLFQLHFDRRIPTDATRRGAGVQPDDRRLAPAAAAAAAVPTSANQISPRFLIEYISWYSAIIPTEI